MKCKTCGLKTKFKQKLGSVHCETLEYVCPKGHTNIRKLIDGEEVKDTVF
jgi:Zn finger protein HypA/HybF involved in hydrogenase expression